MTSVARLGASCGQLFMLPALALLALGGCEGGGGHSSAPAGETISKEAPVTPARAAPPGGPTSNATAIASAVPPLSRPTAGSAASEPRLHAIASAAPLAAASVAVVASAPIAVSAAIAEPPPTRSAEQTEPSFRLWAQSSGRYHAGTPGRFEIVVVASGDYHCNPNYPYKLTLGPAPAAVSFPSPVVRAEAMSIAEKRAVMSVPILPSAAGVATLTGRFALSVCTSQVCHTETRDVALTITID